MKRWVLAAVATGSITMWVAAPARANESDYLVYLEKTSKSPHRHKK
jgi:hypothetical protein